MYKPANHTLLLEDLEELHEWLDNRADADGHLNSDFTVSYSGNAEMRYARVVKDAIRAIKGEQ